jgi:hypothetical protein
MLVDWCSILGGIVAAGTVVGFSVLYGFVLGAVLTPVILALTVLQQGWLTVAVDDYRIEARYGALWIRGRWDLRDVLGAEEMNLSGITRWVRLSFDRKNNFVLGRRAVVLRMRSGRNVRIGSSDPQSLIAAIKRHGLREHTVPAYKPPRVPANKGW